MIVLTFFQSNLVAGSGVWRGLMTCLDGNRPELASKRAETLSKSMAGMDEVKRCNRKNGLQEVDGGTMTLSRSDDRRTRCDNLLMLGYWDRMGEANVVMTDLLVGLLLNLQERFLVRTCQMLEGQRLGELVCSFPVREESSGASQQSAQHKTHIR